MKYCFAFILICLSYSAFSQNESFDALLANGKAEFKKEYDKQDYAAAVQSLEKAVKLKPKNAEAHYFLGYAYSRVNAKDGRNIVESNLALTLKSSEQFETVIKLSPKYKGEMVVLDPYSKLSSEWGTLAMSYWYRDKKDSAIWAFREGRNRGGFNEYMLSANRAALDLCSSKSILMSSGDNFTFSLWFLQIVEGYRTDVAVIDVSLLNTVWYPAFLSKKKVVAFDYSDTELDTVEYCNWKPTWIKIGGFSWIVFPSFNNNSVLRGDLLFLSLLRENKFEREVYFTSGFNRKDRLSLDDHIISLVLIDKLVLDKTVLNNGEKNSNASRFLILTDKINMNSPDQIDFLDNIRTSVLIEIGASLENGDRLEAKQLLALLDQYAGEKKYPYRLDTSKKYVKYLRVQLKEKK